MSQSGPNPANVKMVWILKSKTNGKNSAFVYRTQNLDLSGSRPKSANIKMA